MELSDFQRNVSEQLLSTPATIKGQSFSIKAIWEEVIDSSNDLILYVATTVGSVIATMIITGCVCICIRKSKSKTLGRRETLQVLQNVTQFWREERERSNTSNEVSLNDLQQTKIEILSEMRQQRQENQSIAKSTPQEPKPDYEDYYSSISSAHFVAENKDSKNIKKKPGNGNLKNSITNSRGENQDTPTNIKDNSKDSGYFQPDKNSDTYIDVQNLINAGNEDAKPPSIPPRNPVSASSPDDIPTTPPDTPPPPPHRMFYRAQCKEAVSSDQRKESQEDLSAEIPSFQRPRLSDIYLTPLPQIGNND